MSGMGRTVPPAGTQAQQTRPAAAGPPAGTGLRAARRAGAGRSQRAGGGPPPAVAQQAADAAATGRIWGAGRLDGRMRNGSPVPLRGEASSEQIQEENLQWQSTAFPSYMQSAKHDFCQNWDEAMQDVERRHTIQRGVEQHNAVTSTNPVWQTMRKEAARDAAREPMLSSFLYASILSHDSFAECLAFVLANRLSDPTMLATEFFETFMAVFNQAPQIVQAALDDIQAVRERDPACSSYSNALLFYKGYQAIQVHRTGHHLWQLGQRISALNLQSRISQVFAIDIHPQARFGTGILMDHGTGVVVGQTAVVGNNVSILQNVTLGGTGKAEGDRHPKIQDNVLLGAGATILGSITVGKGAMVASGSLVLKHVPPKTMVAGSPAREVGTVSGNPALKMQHWIKSVNPDSDPFSEHPAAAAAAEQRPAEAQAPARRPDSLASGTALAQPSGRPSQRAAAPLQEPAPQEAASQRGQQHASPLTRGSSARAGGDSGAADGRRRQQPQPREEANVVVVGVRSDTKARRLWPQGPEPEYHL